MRALKRIEYNLCSKICQMRQIPVQQVAVGRMAVKTIPAPATGAQQSLALTEQHKVRVMRQFGPGGAPRGNVPGIRLNGANPVHLAEHRSLLGVIVE